MILIKILIVFLLIVPASLLTFIIWIFGGWIKGFDNMPNPVYTLMEWLDA